MATRNKPLFVEIGQGLSLMIGLPTISSWKTKNRPKKPLAGTVGFNIETTSLEYWDGENWYSALLS